MHLTVIGCAGSFPGPESAASCYLVEYDDFRLLLDLGNGALGALQRHLDPIAIDAVLVSHQHVDHCIDLCSLDVYLRYHPAGRQPAVPVFGPPGLADRIRAAAGDWPGLALDFQELAPGLHRIGPFEVTAAQVAHPGVSYGYRIAAGGRTLAYSGDTGPTPALVGLARDADVALFEASFRSGAANPPDLHLTGAEAAQIALGAGAAKLLLTHLVGWFEPGYALQEAVSHPDVALAYPGLTLSV